MTSSPCDVLFCPLGRGRYNGMWTFSLFYFYLVQTCLWYFRGVSVGFYPDRLPRHGECFCRKSEIICSLKVIVETLCCSVPCLSEENTLYLFGAIFAACFWKNTSMLHRVYGFHLWSAWKHPLHWGLSILLDKLFIQ